MMYWCRKCDRDVPVVSQCHRAKVNSYGTCGTCGFECRPVCGECGRPIEEY